MTRELEGKIMDNEDLVREYSNNLTTYEQFTNLMETYICNLLNREQISFHSITSRTKSIESLSKKIELKNKYQKLDEIKKQIKDCDGAFKLVESVYTLEEEKNNENNVIKTIHDEKPKENTKGSFFKNLKNIFK